MSSKNNSIPYKKKWEILTKYGIVKSVNGIYNFYSDVIHMSYKSSINDIYLNRKKQDNLSLYMYSTYYYY